MPDKTHELVRDLFLFSTFTGLAYSDVKNLTEDNLQTFFDGNLWIITRRKKTNTESNIRLLDVPRKIIEKYRGMTRDNKVFPMPSNTTCNKKLKAIAKLCGIKVHLTYHVARHSAATTVLLSNGVPIETVSRLLGHTNIKTTQIYAKITAQKISQDMETLSQQTGGYGKEHLQCHSVTLKSNDNERGKKHHNNERVRQCSYAERYTGNRMSEWELCELFNVTAPTIRQG